MIQLYKAFFTSQLEYAAAVWQIGDTSSLEKIQMEKQAMCLRIPVNAETLEVEAGE